MNTSILTLFLRCTAMLILCYTSPLLAQNDFGDNFGTHKAVKDLNMDLHNVKSGNLINSKLMLLGNAAAITNSSIALQIDGLDKALLMPRVTDLLNATTPSIPTLNLVNGMVVYDSKTNRFYFRQNGMWIDYVDTDHFVARYLPQVVLGQKIFKSDSGFVARGTFGTGIIPATGVGTRMMWYPAKAAFRVGYANATSWEDNVIGIYSVAMGQSDVASGVNGISLGYANNASGAYSAAFGYGVSATGLRSAGMGMLNTAGGENSTVIGSNSSANGLASIALGTKVGSNHTGSFSIGDNSTTVMTSVADNRFRARFAGGFEFYTAGDLSRSFYANSDGVLKYKGDYRAGFDSRSIVDKAYLEYYYQQKSPLIGGTTPVSTNGGVAVGDGSRATGVYSFAYGNGTNASGDYSMAGGLRSTASGSNALALGQDATASAMGCVAMGTNVTTNGRAGSFVFGDGTTAAALTSANDNEMSTRFSGGYRFYSNNATTIGVQMPAGSNGWSATSDKRKKENFEKVDAASFLSKIDTMKLGSWNYIGQDAKTLRHYGPMAQDFYGAFGKDSYGTIGCDTTITTTDFDGVNLIAIKGLVDITNKLIKENEVLRAKIAMLNSSDKKAVAQRIQSILQQKILEQEAKEADLQRTASITNQSKTASNK